MFSLDIDTEIFSEGIQHKIFDTMIVTALGRTLGHSDSSTRWSAVKFFTAALAQGVLLFFHRILTLKYFQRGFGTRYLILRSLPHLDMHLVTQIPAPDGVQSNSSLLP